MVLAQPRTRSSIRPERLRQLDWRVVGRGKLTDLWGRAKPDNPNAGIGREYDDLSVSTVRQVEFVQHDRVVLGKLWVVCLRSVLRLHEPAVWTGIRDRANARSIATIDRCRFVAAAESQQYCQG